MVIDASVLIDIWVTSRPRHKIALLLAEHIKKNNIRVVIPMHALLELKCAIDNERNTPGCGELDTNIFTKENPLSIQYVAIDNKFIMNYLNLSVPYIKAGDLPYILIAKKDNYPLITEDKKQYNVASMAGVKVYKVSEYLNL